MYTTHSKHYPDIIRVWHKRTLQGLPRSTSPSRADTRKKIMARSIGGLSTVTSSAQLGLYSKDKSDHASKTNNDDDGENGGNHDWYDDEDEGDFPSYVDPTEERELCIDPIRVLAIPRSRYRTITELTLCRKGITRIHPNVQLLENLNTLIIRHNRLRRIDFLLPTRETQESQPTSTAQDRHYGAIAAAAAGSTINSPAYNVRGCRLIQRLYASHNFLQTLEGDVSRLRQLEVLMLAHNCLGNLRAVSTHLKPLRWLRELDLRGNPLCDEVGYRLFLIHEHPNIEILDRRAVRPEERKEAAALYGSNKVNTPQRAPIDTTALVSTQTGAASRRTSQSPLLRGLSRETLVEEEEETGQRREGRKWISKSVTFPSLCQSQQQQQQPCEFSTPSKKETAKKTVAFLSTFTPPSEDADTTKAHHVLYKPSPCEILLRKKIRSIEAKRLKKLEKETEKQMEEQREIQEKYKAFHAIWALSRQGMPLSSENWDSFLKTLDAPVSGASVASNELSSIPQRRLSGRRRSQVSRQQAVEAATVATKSTTVSPGLGVGIGVEEIQLPPVPPVIKGHVDYSVLYDALFGHSDVVNVRVGTKQECLPNPNRLLRMDDVLKKTTEVLRMQQKQEQDDGTGGDIKSKQVSLFRAIQEEKESLVPEPWERTTVDGLTTTMSVSEQLEYLYRVALTFFLPTELSALEGQFMTNTAEAAMPQEQQRMKRSTRKEKQRPSDSALAGVINITPAFPSSFALVQQRLPMVLTATNVEVGPAEHMTFLRLMGMLDGDSGAWSLNLDEMTEAFSSAYQTKARVSILDAFGKGDECANMAAGRRARRSVVKLRVKRERRVGERPPSNAGEARSNTSAVSLVAASSPATATATTSSPSPAKATGTRPVSLMLDVVLLDLLRYLPFVESRLNFFRARCVATASKGEGGATGEAAQEWFAKSQIAATHLDKLHEALKRSGLSEAEAKVRLVPQESIFMRPVREVGELFRKRGD